MDRIHPRLVHGTFRVRCQYLRENVTEGTLMNQRGALISAVSVATYQSVHRVKAASPSL